MEKRYSAFIVGKIDLEREFGKIYFKHKLVFFSAGRLTPF